MLKKRRRLCRRKYSNPGPSFIWHIDGYDKLKYYGFSIHGCINYFSRKILWLHVGTYNKDPNVAAKLYLDTMSEFGGVPKYVSADDGTEHSIREPMLYLSSLDSNREESDVLESSKIISSPKNDLRFFYSSDEAVLNACVSVSWHS